MNKLYILTAILVMLGNLLIAQVTSNDVFDGQMVELNSDTHPGNVQWQVSPDGTVWSDIGGATSDSYAFTVSGTVGDETWYRSRVQLGTCLFPSTEHKLTIIDAPACAGLTSVTDINGNVYDLVEIGDQCWMAENLNTTKYNNGEDIATGLDFAGWVATASGAWAHYGDDPANGLVYGKIYNWYAAADSRNVCPTGWHVPDDMDWNTLGLELGGVLVAGGKMKSTNLWLAPNNAATNSSGFTALPGGYRHVISDFIGLNTTAEFWSSSVYPGDEAWFRGLRNDLEQMAIYGDDKNRGMSIRCVKD